MQIDKFGRFAYVLVRLSDRLAGSKLLVRGKNGRSEQQLLLAVTKEVGRLLSMRNVVACSMRLLLLPAMGQLHCCGGGIRC